MLALIETPPDARDLGLVDAMFDIAAQGILTPAHLPPYGGLLTTAAVTLTALLPELPTLSDAEKELMGDGYPAHSTA